MSLMVRLRGRGHTNGLCMDVDVLFTCEKNREKRKYGTKKTFIQLRQMNSCYTHITHTILFLF